MPKQQPRPARQSGSATADEPPAPALADLADALFRCASESCRQHQRYSCLVELGGLPFEQRAGLATVSLCDAFLAQITGEYQSAARGAGRGDDAWWHKANKLLHASREYLRVHQRSEEASRRLHEHSIEKLTELTLDYAFEASALLALQQAVEDYRKTRPGAALTRENGAGTRC